jgi:uncharacterized protein YceK
MNDQITDTMKHTLLIFGILGFVVCGSGCGTIATHFEGGDEAIKAGAYRGVRYDYRNLGDDQAGGILFFDIPFSAAADTLILPYDLSHMTERSNVDTAERQN